MKNTSLFLFCAFILTSCSVVDSVKSFASNQAKNIMNEQMSTTSAKISDGGSTQVTSSQNNEFINNHNKLRNTVGVANISWSNKVASSAQKWADNLQKQGCVMKHSPSSQREGYGENIAWSKGYYMTPSHATNMWGGEKKHYNYRTNKCQNGKVCGHYTQMVWRNTKHIGCGVAKCAGKTSVMVCQYSPAGNYYGEKPY